LIVELDAKTDKLNSKLNKIDKKLGGVGSKAKITGKELVSMGKTAAAAAAAAAAAISATAISAANFAKEIQLAATRANETVEEMQALAFATNTVGISLEDLGDISKDTNEKIGEFLTTGGGGFVDFIDVMKIGKNEARELALEFQNLSGPQVLQEMVRQMQDAGISGNQMSFALEGMASEATDLIPLLKDNAFQLKQLKGEFQELGTVLSQEQIDRLKQVGAEFSKLSQTFSAEGRALIADYSEEIINAIQVITTLGVTTIDAFNVISVGWGNLIELSEAGLTDLVNGTDTFGETLIERTNLTQDALNELLGKNDKALEISLKKGNKVNKDTAKFEKQSQSERLKNQQNFLKAGSILANTFFEDNKAIQAAFIVAETAAGIARQFADLPFPAAIATSAVVAATGIAQLAALNSASPGGGTISTPGGGSALPQQQNFEPETSSLGLTEATDAGSDVLRIEFATDTGDDLMDAIANSLNEGQKRGQF